MVKIHVCKQLMLEFHGLLLTPVRLLSMKKDLFYKSQIHLHRNGNNSMTMKIKRLHLRNMSKTVLKEKSIILQLTLQLEENLNLKTHF